MSIRYHLLLIAGITTTVVFLASFFLESFLLNRSLDTAGKASEALYEKMFSKRMEYLTDFVQDALIERLAQVNALLRTVAQYKPLAEWFSPSLEHRQKGTWSSAASLIQQDDWISFLQNTTEQEELSLIAPSRGPFSFAQFVPVEEGIVFAYMPGEEKESFIGVQVVSKFLEVDQKDGDGLGTLGILPIVYALYTIDTLKALDFSSVEDSSYIPTPYTHGTEVDEQLFLKVLARAMDLVHAPGFHIPPFTGQITEITPSPVETLSFQQEVEMSLNKKLSYAGELFVIWQAGVLRECGAFGVKEFRLPDAMCFSATEGQGEVFFLSDVMGFAKRWFDDEQFYAKNPPSALTSLVSSGSEIIPGPKEGQAFLVNTAAIFEEEEQGKRRSLLTIGASLHDVVDDLVATTRSFTCILSKGRVLVNRAPEGKEKISTLAIDSLGTELVQRKEGNIAIGDNCYYFSCIDPDPSLDVHFLLFHPKDDEFDFSYNFRMFQQQMVDLVHQLDLDRRSLEGIGILVLWLLLLRLSKKITRPIITLAGALPHVKRAEWDQIQLPDIPFQKGKKKDNEIVMLYDSFHDMVNGMKEKEKVTGILNKVVSPEIAREILKGNISLGGEDRVVSMLFVDIRGFTKLTQDMPPHEVITLLNSCMTRLAAIVEKHGGVIDKFLGDGLMALYGAPVASVEHARNAIRSGLEMIASIKLWNQERQAMQAGPIFIGVGVHAGPVCVGNMGAQDRLNYTVIGSHVNLASRLCSSAEPSALLITEDTKKEPGVAEGFSFEDRGLMSFKGFDQPKHVLQVKQEL